MPEPIPFLEVIHNVDWAATLLGSMDSWSPALHQNFSHILADSRPIALYWGPSYATLYNEAFSRLCGPMSPHVLGRSVDDLWPETADRLRDTMRACAAKKRPSLEQEWRFFVRKDDYSPHIAAADDGGPRPPAPPRLHPHLQETYLQWSISPIYAGDECLGFAQPVLETTSVRLWERRTKMLIDLGEVLVTARDVKSYWAKTIQELDAVQPGYDIPLAVLYSVAEDPYASPVELGSYYDSSEICTLEGSLGVDNPHHPLIPEKLHLRSSDQGLSSVFREALRVRRPVLVQTADRSLSPELLHGLQWRGFGDPCTAAIVCPLRPTREENIMGLLFLGLNPRRPYDNDYQQYIALLNQKLTTSLASTVLLEEEARRGRNMAEQAVYDRETLRRKLEAQTKEATETMQKFKAVAEFIPVGMCFGDAHGNINFANDAWYRITGHPGSRRIGSGGLLSCAVEEDRPIIARAYDDLQSGRTVNFEFRVRRRNSGGTADATPPTQASPVFERGPLDLSISDDWMERHILASAKAERATSGSVIRVLTCVTDVTLHKKTAEEALRRAQQAENFRRMAEFATVGMYDMDLEGCLLGANNVFLEMCGLEKSDSSAAPVKPWETCINEEDYPLIRQRLSSMVAEGKVQNVEVRLKASWEAEDRAGHRVVVPKWVQVTLLPVRDAEGSITSFTGCLTDVSLQKWQLEREKERKEDALESKRQQENFIDMTSHEMRNPLSAIVHCADAITGTLTKVQELVAEQSPAHVPTSAANVLLTPAADGVGVDDHLEATKDVLAEAQQLIGNSIDNAETIASCAQHQRRIVDDILTMSKLGYKLVSLSLTTVDTIDVVQGALKMFEIEARRVDINLSMQVDQSYYDLNLRYLDFDPSRLKQVLVNLLTNALKFTKTGPTRNVSVTMRASRTRPTEASSSVQFVPQSDESHDESADNPPRQDRGEPIFLIFEVKDTGQGLTEDEKKSLFQRFVQASSRTHVKYGGSGLGLFISRRLVELQNGAIGVASMPGVGSTFTFYIEAYAPSPEAIKEAEASSGAAAAAKRLVAGGPVRNGLGRRNFASPSAVMATTLRSAIRPGSRRSGEASPVLPEIEGVLVVEDNLINQQITRRGLLERKFIVDVANHGVEALEKLRLSDRFAVPHRDETASDSGTPVASETNGAAPAPLSPPAPISPPAPTLSPAPTSTRVFPLSLILMDIEMPIQDGLTCTKHIRDMERDGKIKGGRIPIIAVSANARTEQIVAARAAGCDDVLVKPYRMPELIEKMHYVVAKVAALDMSPSPSPSPGPSPTLNPGGDP